MAEDYEVKENENEEDETEDQELQEVHAEALRQFDRIQSVTQEERKQSKDDRRFVSIAGAMWEGDWGKQFENKPKLEVNKIQLSLMRIHNEYRNNPLTVDFISKDGSDNDKLADICDGLYRADEQDSTASEAYDNAFDEATSGGYGAWRLRAELENEEDYDDDSQRIMIEPIFDADTSVFFDLDAKRQDKADANHCFVISAMTRTAYEKEYSDDPTSWPKSTDDYQFDWTTPDIVYVAEYYVVEFKKEIIKIFKFGEGVNALEERHTAEELDADPELELELIDSGFKEVGEKKIKRRKVRKYILSGGSVLEDCGWIAGKLIPIVPMYGKRFYIENIERSMGHVRLSKDAQRLKNMQLSKLAEISALSSTEKPIFTPEQMVGHGNTWAEDNIKNNPYLLVNPVTDAAGNPMPAGPIGYTKPPAIAPALGALLTLTEDDMKDILGEKQGGEAIVSNVSGKAVQLIQDRMDMQTFIYMSNMAKSMKRSGQIWLSMAQDIYVETGRKMKVIGVDQKVSSIELNQNVMSDENKIIAENDLSNAKMDVVAEVGPSTSSKRESTVNNLMAMMNGIQDPETLQVLTSTVMMNMEGEGIQDTRDFFRKKLIRAGAVTPTDEEAAALQEEIANTPEDPNSVYLKAEAQNANAKAAKAQADTIKTLAETEQTKAETAETLAKIPRDEREALIENIQAMAEVVQSKEA